MPALLFAQKTDLDTVYIAPGDSTIRLNNKFVIPASIQFDTSLSKFSDDAIEVVSNQGLIYFKPAARDSLIFTIKYKYLPLDFPNIVYLNEPPRIYRSPITSKQNNSPKNNPRQSISDNQVSYDFLKSGTVFRGINLKSNSGMSIQSGLDLKLEGKFTDDIRITGALTDKNVPIQPEGNTQQINEIDKVFLTLNMPNENFTFGDYYLNLNQGRYGNYSRKLQGVKFSSKRGNFTSQAAGAVSRGKFHTNKFKGQEGKQGPYQLKGKNGEEAIIILAGTEQVYINGRRVLRGENNDYTIDYSTGEITFTPNQLITSNSRITVDFQYSDLVYQKNIVMANSGISLSNDKLKVSAQFINEADDRHNPIELELTDEDKNLLQKTGDNGRGAFKSTIKSDSSGSYILQDSVLIYTGKNKGTHTATFYNIGSRGKYRKHYTSEKVYFEYVDKNDPAVSRDLKEQAIYLPAKPLKMPQKQQQYHLQTVWEPVDNFTLNTELTGSNLDRNTFSNIDDNDNQGLAVNLSSRYISPQTDFGQFTVNGNFRNENRRFRAIDRNKSIEYERKWDTGLAETPGERVYESNIQYSYQDNIRLKLEGGGLGSGKNSTRRMDSELRFQYRWLKNLHYQREDINTNLEDTYSKEWIRQRAGTRLEVFGFRPFYEFYSEYRTNDSLAADNFKFYENSIGIGSGEQGKVNWNVRYHFRDNYERNGGSWQEESRGQDLSLFGKLNNWHSFTASIQFTNRNKKYYDSEQANSRYYLMKGQIIQRPQKLPFDWRSNFRVDEKYTVKKEKIYYKVERGEGNYIYDSTYADYVPHQLGNYILRIIPTNIRRPVTNFKTGFQFRFKGRKLYKNTNDRFLSRFSSFTNLRLDQEIKNNHQLSNLYNLSLAKVDSNWINYYRFFQQDIDYDFKSIRGYLKFRYKKNDNISELDIRGNEERFREEYTLKYRGPMLWNIKLESEADYHHNIRHSEISNMRNHKITGYSWENKLSYRFNTSNKLGFDFKLQQDRETETSNVESLLSKIKLEYERNFSRKGRTKSFIEFNQVRVTPDNSTIPWEMSDGRKEGLTFGFGLSIEYKIARYLNLRANYEGWKEPYFDFYQLGNVELRAFF